ncbi:peptidase M20 [Clostridia bacterium]|nr:peptidase M20 [Clostridia bacterium]
MSVVDNLKSQEFVKIRRIIHQNPELAYCEFETARFISEYLVECGIPVVTGLAKTGVVGTIEKEFAAETLLIRADMDALPIHEKTGLPFASIKGAAMHACGHDAHVAIALGAAKNIMARKDELKSNIKFVFQPAEESGNGAVALINDGVMDGNVTGAIALHVNPDVQVGTVTLKNGNRMASNDSFEIILKGIGGHGACPTQNSSITYVCAQIVDNLYSVVTRKFHAAENALISICNIECGNTYNVMPSTAAIRGTIRTYSEDIRDVIPVYMEQIVGCIAAAYDVEHEFRLKKGHPPVVNDIGMVKKAQDAAEGVAQVNWLERPSMTSDDFAYYAHRVPACYIGLGCGNVAKGITHPLHSEYFDLDEDCIQVGVNFLTNFALTFS